MRALATVRVLRASLAAALGLTSAVGIDAACGGQTTPGADAGSAGTRPRTACVDPVPVVVNGKDTGFDTCQGGTVRRRAVVECPTAPLPPSTCAPLAPDASASPGQCTSNGDCDAGLFGTCNAGFYSSCNCSYGCTRDSDCASGQICQCGDPVGRCVPASCNAGTCGAGLECATYQMEYCPGCNAGFACQTAADTCFSPLDCGDGGGWACSIASGTSRACSPVGMGGSCCGFGRPFLVDHQPRVAALAERRDWLASVTPEVASLPPWLRARLAAHWTAAGLMEHASIAAFARFVLQLLSLGAPPDLVGEAQRALEDETRHARLAFGLASAYAGTPTGPGRLDVRASLEETDLRSILATTFADGCIGETVAALEATEAIERLGDRDPAVAAVLATLAVDEARHAELAWRTVAWAVRAFGEEARDALEDALRAALADEALHGPVVVERGSDASGEALSERGALGERLRSTIRSEALRGVVVPLARALLAGEAEDRELPAADCA